MGLGGQASQWGGPVAPAVVPSCFGMGWGCWGSAAWQGLGIGVDGYDIQASNHPPSNHPIINPSDHHMTHPSQSHTTTVSPRPISSGS